MGKDSIKSTGVIVCKHSILKRIDLIILGYVEPSGHIPNLIISPLDPERIFGFGLDLLET